MPVVLKDMSRLTPEERGALSALTRAVYPDTGSEMFPATQVTWAPHARGVFVTDESGRLLSFVGLLVRGGLLDDTPTRIGGIGAVKTDPTARRRGWAKAGIAVAVAHLRNEARVDFALLFCRATAMPFYRRLGWRVFEGDLHADSNAGPVFGAAFRPMTLAARRTAPGTGKLDIRGLPW